MVLVSKAKRGKGKSSNKNCNSEGEASQLGKKKHLSKFKCFVCHKNGHYASQYTKKKVKGKKQQVAAFAET